MTHPVIVIDVVYPYSVFSSFLTQSCVDPSQHHRIIFELTTQALGPMGLPEAEFMFELLNKPERKYFEDIDILVNNVLVWKQFSELFKEYALYLLIELKKLQKEFGISGITDYLLVDLTPSSAVINLYRGS